MKTVEEIPWETKPPRLKQPLSEPKGSGTHGEGQPHSETHGRPATPLVSPAWCDS